ncbi:MAG: DUF4386 family protein [Candidatus Kariarchaeaceae archaeon]|jgi:hypothetical protein
MTENKLEPSMAKLGSYLSMLAGFALLIFGVTYLLRPEDQQGSSIDDNADDYFNSLEDKSVLFSLSFWAFGLSAIFAIGALMALSDLVSEENKGVVRYISVMGIIGYASIMIVSFSALARGPELADTYVNMDSSGQTVVEAYGLVSIDPWFLVQFGLVGIWVFGLNWLAFKGGQLPKNLSIIGMGAGFAYWLASISFIFDSPILRIISAGVGGIILAPIYFFWLAMKFRETTSE